MAHIIDLDQLTAAERLDLIGELWDSLSNNLDDVPLTAEQKAELDRRLDDLEANPNSGSSWEDVRRRIESQLES